MDCRPATPEDAPAVAAVARASWHAAYDDLLGAQTVEHTVDEWYDVDSLRESVETGVFLVAVEDGKAAGDESDGDESDGDRVVGFAHAGPSRTDDDPADAFLSRLYVHPDEWGAGVGTRLLEAVATRLRDDGHADLWLEVVAGNEVGVGFYDARGFQRVGTVEETFEGTTVETLHLRAELAALAG